MINIFILLARLQYILDFFFFFNDTATTEIYTLSLHDALPIYGGKERKGGGSEKEAKGLAPLPPGSVQAGARVRSEEHTSELQSPCNLVCRLLLEKKNSASAMRSFCTSASGAHSTSWLLEVADR